MQWFVTSEDQSLEMAAREAVRIASKWHCSIDLVYDGMMTTIPPLGHWADAVRVIQDKLDNNERDQIDLTVACTKCWGTRIDNNATFKLNKPGTGVACACKDGSVGVAHVLYHGVIRRDDIRNVVSYKTAWQDIFGKREDGEQGITYQEFLAGRMPT